MSRVLQALGLRTQPLAEAPVTTIRSDDCQTLLMALMHYGPPRLAFSGTGTPGWYCHVKLAGFSRGVEGEVRSDWSHGSPKEALECCLQRCVEALGTCAGGAA